MSVPPIIRRQKRQGRCVPCLLCVLWFGFGLVLGFVETASAQTRFPAAPEGRDILLWDAPEGLYEREGNLVVVARYDDKTASPNQSQNIGILLLRVSTLMQAYVTGTATTTDRYSQILLSHVLQRPEILPKANREVARQLGPNQGRLVLEFPGGAELIRQSRANVAAIDMAAVAQEVKAASLSKPDASVLRLFAARNGEVLDELRLAAETVEPAHLLTLAPANPDLLAQRDALLQLYCTEPKCALRPQAHLALAKSLTGATDTASIHALLARWTADPKIRQEADATLKGLWAADQAHSEFYLLMKQCEKAGQEPSLAGLVIARCGLYWPVPSRRATEAFDQAEASFRKGTDPQATLALLLQVVEQDPGHARAWSYLGSIFVYLKREEAALAALQQSVLLDPRSLDARLNLADSYRRLGAPTLAKALYHDILARLAAGQNAEFIQNIRGEVTARLNDVSPSKSQ